LQELTLESILLGYGPLGIMCIGLGWAVIYLWREYRKVLKCKQELSKSVRDVIIQARDREVELLRELAEHENEQTKKYLKLSRELNSVLNKILKQLGTYKEVGT
jgi:hypothetical protein